MAAIKIGEMITKLSEKTKQLELATLLLKSRCSIQYRDIIQENLEQTEADLLSISEELIDLRETLEALKAENEYCKELISLLDELDHKIKHMDENIPPGIKDFVKTNTKTEISDSETNYNNENISSSLNNQSSVLSFQSASVKSCKKLIFDDEPEICPIIMPITDIEFSKIPKYIIGRQSLNTLNNLIKCINQILKAKYTLLSLGKDGARKKGELDLYLEYKKQQTYVKDSEGDIYFFTAEDYQRHTSSKLDKIKLNMLTALRSCKRLREIRMGKSLYYMIVPTS